MFCFYCLLAYLTVLGCAGGVCDCLIGLYCLCDVCGLLRFDLLGFCDLLLAFAVFGFVVWWIVAYVLLFDLFELLGLYLPQIGFGVYFWVGLNVL